VRRAAFHDVRDEDLVASPAERAQVLRQEVGGAADERPAQPILVEARALADEHDLGVGAPLPRDGVRASLVEAAAGAGADLRRNVVARRPALAVGHADPPAAAGTASAAWYGGAPRAAADLTQPRARSASAIWTAFVAAPLR